MFSTVGRDLGEDDPQNRRLRLSQCLSRLTVQPPDTRLNNQGWPLTLACYCVFVLYFLRQVKSPRA